MSSGIQVSDEVKQVYEQVKMNGPNKRQFALFKLNDDKTEIVLDYMADKCESKSNETKEKGQAKHFQEVINTLPKKDGRYLLFDYEYEGKHGPASKLVLIMWCPEILSVNMKMLYASSKDALKKTCKDIGADIQADCLDDLSTSDVEFKLKK